VDGSGDTVSAEIKFSDGRPGTSLEDVYVKLGEAEIALVDLAILCGRHLPLEFAQAAERALSIVQRLHGAVLPEPDEEGPF
jgi:hypothetical protein